MKVHQNITTQNSSSCQQNNHRLSSKSVPVLQKQEDALLNSLPLQMVRNVNHAAVNFAFDAAGTKTAPVGHPTNPIARSAWVNTKIGENMITHANNTAIYQSGHQVAARFNGANDGDNVAAWPDLTEDAYSTEEDRIDQGAAAARANETGVLNVQTSYQDAGTLLGSMVTAAYAATGPKLLTGTNWDNLNVNSATAHPANADLNQALVEGTIRTKFNTQAYGVTDSHVAASVTMDYAASVNGAANAARSFNYNSGAIALPTWNANAADWEAFLLTPANKPRLAAPGGNFRLERLP